MQDSFDLIMCSHGDWFAWEQNGYFRRTARLFQEFEADDRVRQILLVPNRRSYVHHLRRPSLNRRVGDVVREVDGLRATMDRVGPKTRVLTFYVPLPRDRERRLLRAANRRFLRTAFTRDTVFRMAATLGFERPVLWVDDPFMTHLLGSDDASFSVFDCIDDWRLNPRMSQLVAELDRAYERAVRMSDLFLTVSRPLRDSFQTLRDDVVWIPNGVDAQAFRTSSGDLHDVFAGLPHPRVCYVASMGDCRMDLPLMVATARSLPDVSFVVVGSNPPLELRQLPNCHLLGTVHPERIPAVLASCDVGVLPHKRDRYNASAYPLKLLEYLAAGLPVVATPVSGVDDFAELVYTADNAEEFSGAVRCALSERDEGLRRRRQDAVASASWRRRHDDIMSTVLDRMSLNARDGASLPMVSPG